MAYKKIPEPNPADLPVNRPEKPPGRPTKYQPDDYPEKAYNLLLQGHLEKDAATILGVHLSTWCDWKNIYPAFANAVSRAKSMAVPALIEPYLLKTAQGFTYDEEDIMPDGGKIVHKRFAHPNVKAQLAALARYDPEYRRSQADVRSPRIGMVFSMSRTQDPQGQIEAQSEGETEG